MQPQIISERARAAAAELKRRRETGGVRYFEVKNPDQAHVLRSLAKGRLVLGGNRSGKTVVGAVETVFRHLGKHPWKELPHRAPIHSWCISQTLPGATDKPHVQLAEIKRWAPADALRGGSWSAAYSPGARTLHWANGGVTEFKSYDQSLLAFESAKIHWCWFDEEPARREIWSSSVLRLLDYKGQWMMTLTPVLSLQGQGWVEELWEDRANPDCAYETYQLFTTRNTSLDAAEVEVTFANLSDEEKKVRAEGAFARLGGRVLGEFSEERHGVQVEFVPPRDWRHYLIIDPGWNKAAHLFAAVDPDGRIFLYEEHYEGQQLPEYHVRACHGIWQMYGAPSEIRVLMDPAGFSLKRTTTGRESPSDADEYLAAAQRIGAHWLAPQPADNSDSYAWRVKRYLSAGMMGVFPGLHWWRWEQERWTRQKERDGPAAQEKPVPDKPIDRNNHLMDCTRYLCNELPDPLHADEFVPPSLERKAGVAPRAQERGEEW